jgi:hypothetical protein
MSRKPTPTDPGLEAIDAWERWFRAAHEERLAECPDRHLVEQERAHVDALATAISSERREHYLARKRIQP